MVCLLREKNQLEQVQICSKLEIILTFSRKCLFYRIFTLPNFTLHTPSGVQISLLYLEFITRNFSKLSIIFKNFKLSKKFQYITIADQNCINFDM